MLVRPTSQKKQIQIGYFYGNGVSLKVVLCFACAKSVIKILNHAEKWNLLLLCIGIKGNVKTGTGTCVKNSCCDPNLASEWFLRLLLCSFSSGKTENRKFAEKPTTLNQQFQVSLVLFSKEEICIYVSSSNSWILMNCFP